MVRNPHEGHCSGPYFQCGRPTRPLRTGNQLPQRVLRAAINAWNPVGLVSKQSRETEVGFRPQCGRRAWQGGSQACVQPSPIATVSGSGSMPSYNHSRDGLADRVLNSSRASGYAVPSSINATCNGFRGEINQWRRERPVGSQGGRATRDPCKPRNILSEACTSDLSPKTQATKSQRRVSSDPGMSEAFCPSS